MNNVNVVNILIEVKYNGIYNFIKCLIFLKKIVTMTLTKNVHQISLKNLTNHC